MQERKNFVSQPRNPQKRPHKQEDGLTETEKKKNLSQRRHITKFLSCMAPYIRMQTPFMPFEEMEKQHEDHSKQYTPQLAKSSILHHLDIIFKSKFRNYLSFLLER